MSLESWINTLELLLPIAKAVPVLGSPVEGSLEAAVKILQFAQARRPQESPATTCSQSYAGSEDEQRADEGAR
jgi:hypothetical protein